MANIQLPDEILPTLREFRVCEFSTLAKDGTPITWPTAARWLPGAARFLITTSIGLPQKAFNVRRNPNVALFFSDPTGSGLQNPPSVLVQGHATAPDEILTSPAGLEDYWRENIFSRQPSSRMISSTPLGRKLMDWYYMRLLIYVEPVRITWWPQGKQQQPFQRLEVQHVA